MKASLILLEEKAITAVIHHKIIQNSTKLLTHAAQLCFF